MLQLHQAYCIWKSRRQLAKPFNPH